MNHMRGTAGSLHKRHIALAVGAYSTCSMLLLIINKVAISETQSPSFVLFCQLLSSAFMIYCFSISGIIHLESLKLRVLSNYWIVACAFLAALYTNARTLQYANVETFIVFRSSTPILISILDYVFLGRELPTVRSGLSLALMLVGSVIYVLTDSNFEVKAYGWVCLWYFVFAFDQVYIKYIVDNVELSVWGRSFVTNLLAVFPVALIGFFTGEVTTTAGIDWNFRKISTLLLSCFVGLAMSFSAFQLRGLVSATTFTVIGTLCKIGTIIINCLIWDNHATPEGLVALGVCIIAGIFYKQAPLRTPS
jgi:solute carrier family 35